MHIFLRQASSFHCDCRYTHHLIHVGSCLCQRAWTCIGRCLWWSHSCEYQVPCSGVCVCVGCGLYHEIRSQSNASSCFQHSYAILVAIASFYFMDFTLNAVQAICRALILDIPPLWQQELANAWSARMSNSAQVIGYFVGFVDLVKYAPWLGDSQMKGFCVVAIIVFVITLGITCLAVHEKPLEKEDDQDNQ